ncbi:MAG: hypothetical protein NC113_06080 [Bacteroides sp.]|nr:hypothetical protein [Bacteroides sp.]MCM1447775.1 hypothetical protein [Bacteroides sp.]MCM1515767.1 hypothetical protein [Paraprevotella sp.]
MKKIYFIIAFLATVAGNVSAQLPTSSDAKVGVGDMSAIFVQARQEFFDPGKTWVYRHHNPHFTIIEDEYYFKIYAIGDTVVKDIKATRLCLERLDNGDKLDDIVVYENNGIIYNYTGEKFYPLMDFNLHYGDVFHTIVPYGNWYEDSQGPAHMIVDERIYSIEGMDRRVLTWKECDYDNGSCSYWIEGIGSPYYAYITAQPITDAKADLIECYDGDRLIYSKARFDELVTGIDEVVSDKCTSETVYDLTGRRVTNPVKGRLYVKSHTKVVW